MWFPKSECVFICRLRLAPILCFWTKGKTHYNCHLFLQPPQENVFDAFTLLHLDEVSNIFASATSRVKISCHHWVIDRSGGDETYLSTITSV
jgi:hypothetical protein